MLIFLLGYCNHLEGKVNILLFSLSMSNVGGLRVGCFEGVFGLGLCVCLGFGLGFIYCFGHSCIIKFKFGFRLSFNFDFNLKFGFNLIPNSKLYSLLIKYFFTVAFHIDF